MVCAVVSSVDLNERAGSSISIHYRSVRCLGEERNLTDCPGISEMTTSCSHNQDAYIVCRPRTFSISRKSRFHFQSHAMYVLVSVSQSCISVFHSHTTVHLSQCPTLVLHVTACATPLHIRECGSILYLGMATEILNLP